MLIKNPRYWRLQLNRHIQPATSSTNPNTLIDFKKQYDSQNLKTSESQKIDTINRIRG